MTHILACDPGLRTGVCLTYFDDETPAEVVATWDISGGQDRFIEWISEHQGLFEESGALEDVFIVYERFIPREGVHGVGTDASEVIGVLLHWARQQGISAVPQPPAGRMKAVPNKVLDKFYVFKGNRDRNVKEAFRHSIWYLKNAKHLPTIHLGWLDE